MVRAITDFVEFCYLVRRSIHTDRKIQHLEEALARFHVHWEVFRMTGIREDFSLPRQHSLDHYPRHIHEFGAPNGLCSSITESKHIKAIKEPYRWFSWFEALGQMLLINQHLDKLAAARTDFEDRGMLQGSLFTATQAACEAVLSDSNDDDPQPTPFNPSVSNDEDEAQEDLPTLEFDLGADNFWSVVEGPQVQASVKLAQRHSKYLSWTPIVQY